MTLEQLITIQRQFDEMHGFKLPKDSTIDKYEQVSKDLIGLFGEIGEFSNVIKKINLSIDSQVGCNNIKQQEGKLREELIDVFIYFLRLADLCDLNIEEEYLNKKAFNEIKYAKYK